MVSYNVIDNGHINKKVYVQTLIDKRIDYS
jgi:hypothetical protein